MSSLKVELDRQGWAGLGLSILVVTGWMLAMVLLPSVWWVEVVAVLGAGPFLIYGVFATGFFNGQRVTYEDFPRLMREEDEKAHLQGQALFPDPVFWQEGENRLH